MNPWIAIVGNRSEGRAELVARLIKGLRARGLSVGGFLHEPLHDKGNTVGYDVVEVGGRGRAPLARHSDTPVICDWGFDEGGFEAARRWTLDGSHDVVVVEVGRLEAAERGHWRTLLSALREGNRLILVTLRPHVLTTVVLKLPDPFDALEMPCSRASEEALVERVAARRPRTTGATA